MRLHHAALHWGRLRWWLHVLLLLLSVLVVLLLRHVRVLTHRHRRRPVWWRRSRHRLLLHSLIRQDWSRSLLLICVRHDRHGRSGRSRATLWLRLRGGSFPLLLLLGWLPLLHCRFVVAKVGTDVDFLFLLRNLLLCWEVVEVLVVLLLLNLLSSWCHSCGHPLLRRLHLLRVTTLLRLFGLLWLLHNLDPLNIVWHFWLLRQVDVLPVSLEDAISDDGQLAREATHCTET